MTATSSSATSTSRCRRASPVTCGESAIAPRQRSQRAAQNAGRDEQSQPSCPASSQIGTTNVAAGPGSHPFHAVGKMYLAGPFKGAPLSLVAITPALAGPYDYGTQVVRVALHVDPLTAQVSAASDTVPQIIGGIPIRMRSIQVNIDRPNFTINPTNCSPFRRRSAGNRRPGHGCDFCLYFHAVNCASLPFKPEDAGAPARVAASATQPGEEPAAAVRSPDAPGGTQHQVALGDAAERVRDRPAPPRQHLLGEGAGRETLRRAHPDRQGHDDRRRCSTSRSPARSTRSPAPAACPAWPSFSTARSTWSRGPTPRPIRRRPAEDHCPGRPRRPDRPFPPQRLRRQDRLPGQHPRPLRASPGRSGSIRRARTAGRERRTSSSRPPAARRRPAQSAGPRAAPPLTSAVPGARDWSGRYTAVRKSPLSLGKCGG